MIKPSPKLVILVMLMLVLVLLGLTGNDALASQVSLAWSDSHHGMMAVGVVTDANGNIYVAGQDYLDASYAGSDDVVLIKYGLAGNRLWVRKTPGVSSWITLDLSGNVLITGSSYPSGSGFRTWKYDMKGNLLWENQGTFGKGIRVATDSSGNVYVTGPNGDSKRTDYVTFKIDPNGKTLWTRIYNGPSDWVDQPTSLAVRSGGRVAVTGNSEGGMVTVVYDTNGNQLWQQKFSSPDPFYYLNSSAVIFGPNGEVYVGGTYLVKYDANGNQVWARPDPNKGYQAGAIYRLALDPSGNVLVIGDFDSGTVLKYSPDGTKIWAQPFTDQNNNPGGLGNLTIGGDGSVYVTGTSQGGILTVKYDSNGNVQWKTDNFDHTVFDLDAGNAVALDSEGNVVVAGQRPILTVRYLQSGSPVPTPTPTKSPLPTATPVPSLSIHSADLDRSSVYTTTAGYWKGTVKILVHDANNKAVSGVTVSGAWSGGYSGSATCTTGTYGRCQMTTARIPNSKSSATLTLKNLSKSGFTYNATANHDPDGDSNGTQITVNKP